MTLAAGAFHKGLMGPERFLLQENPGMAFEAYRLLRSRKQFGLWAGMAHMAGQTPFSLVDRFMGGCRLGLLFSMTAEAQGIARTLEQDGGL